VTLRNLGPDDDIPVIQEELNPELITSLMSNYSSGTDALLEIIDNSVDEIIQGKKLRIDIRISSNKEIVLIERGGRGMDAVRLRHFFRWGKSDKAGREGKLGRYGQGGKAAMGYLGRSFNLIAKSAGEVQGRQIVELDWDDRSTGAKTWIPKTVPVSAPVDEGYVELHISNLNNRRLSQQTLRDRLGNIYRELIDQGKCEITVNSEAVVAMELPLYEKYPVQRVNTSLGRDLRLSGWFGRLRADTARHGRLKGGIRCTVHGRLIKDAEFFGHPGPEYRQSLNQLIGVIEVPFVKLNMNKSDFDRDSDEWRTLDRFMNKQLAPIVNELKGTREQEKITDRDRKRVREAQELFEAAAQRLEMRELLEEKYNTGAGQRRKDEPSRATGVNTLSRKTRSDVGRPHLPATSPPADATGKRSRKGRMLWEPKQLGERTRAYIQPNEKHAVLYINTQYPLYKLTKGDTWYVIETGALEVAKYERSIELSPDEYLLEVNDILAEVFATAG
jgi:Histidine kinase-, DNA gyrase B-, and HSP90-like ATPase